MSFNDNVKNAEDAVENLTKSIKTAEAAISRINSEMLEGGKGFEALVAGASAASDSFKSLSDSIGNLAGVTPIIGKAAKEGVDILTSSFGSLFGAITKIGEAYSEVLKTVDAFTQADRELTDSMFDLTAQFGGSLAEAENFKDQMLGVAKTLATEEFGYINTSDYNEAADAFKNAKIPLDFFRESVVSSAGSMDNLTVGILQAKALGMELPDYFSKLGNAILKQGLDSQGAAEQMAMFGDIASNTGLAVSTVAENLQGLAGSFLKVGINADFGRPLLEGFVNTLDGMGLGIENATDLSNTLGSSLAKLTENYSIAYFTMQKGGLDFGAGGGALGASIGLQAKLLEAEKEPGGQAAVGLELAGAMKDTIASLGGGRVVTVQEAAESPALQQSFYTQQKLLENMYGLDTQSATRTLDYLSQLDEATRSGDTDLANSLGESINETINTKNETVAEMDKLNATANAQLAQLTLQSGLQLSQLQATGAGLREGATGTLERVFDTVGKMVTGEKGAEAGQTLINNQLRNLIELRTQFGDATKSGGEPGERGPADPMMRVLERIAKSTEKLAGLTSPIRSDTPTNRKAGPGVPGVAGGEGGPR